MISVLRACLAQFLCLALVTAEFAPPVRAGMPVEKSRKWGILPYDIGRPAPESARDAVREKYFISTGRRSVRSRQNTQSQLTNLPGQSFTALPDGHLLLLGGEGKQGPLGTAVILDPSSSAMAELPNGLMHARAFHSATLLPSGKVLVFGGVGSDGDLVATAEVFDPTTKQFASLPTIGLTLRAHHTATLLTDGTVFVAGGLDERNQIPGTVQLWDPRTSTAIDVDGQLITPRSDHTAELQADGTVLLWGGKNRVGLAVDYGEVYDPAIQSFRIQNAKPETSQGPLTVAATIPADGSENVPSNLTIAVRFSSPILMQSANTNSVTLTAGTKRIDVLVVPAEAGVLLFVTPQESLTANTEYTVDLNGVASAGSSLAEFSFVFRTADQGNDRNKSTGAVGLPIPSTGFGAPENSPYLKLPRLQAPSGETAISGQVLLQSGLPLEGVTLRVEGNSTQSDATGRFLLVGVPPGHDVLVIDGRTADTKAATYGVFEVAVDAKNRETNDLNYTSWMPVIDTAHAATVAFPTAQETLITTPLIPGLEFHLPAGATVTDIDGKTANQISITPIPVSQPPFPLPKGANIPLYFTIQPGGGIISVSNTDGPGGGWIVHPNTTRNKVGTRFNFWNYDPEKKGWHVKGGGSVRADANAVVPDSGVVIDALTGTSVTCAPIPPVGPNCCGPKDGDPVDLGTGLFVYTKTDLYEPDVIPIELTRTYRQGDSIARDFGIGARHPYDIFVGSSDSANCSYMDLYLPDFTRIHYTRYSNGTGCGANGTPIPNFVCNTCPGEWFGSTLYWDGSPFLEHWSIYRRDGLVFDFPAGAANASIQTLGLIGIHDRNGNYLWITRNQNSYITNITTPNGRFINFSYDSNNNITQAQDGFGRTVQYSYDPNNRLTQVIDANAGVWKYAYDSNNNMTTITNPRQITYLTNKYDPNGRVYQQIHADGGTYQFNYITDPLDNVIETDMTDPRGNIRKVTFNQPPIYYDGYSTGGTVAADTSAAGTSIVRSTSHQYDLGTYLVTSSTDALGRTTSFTYDSAGNLTSVTRLAGTPNQVTTSYTYQVDFAQSSAGPYTQTFTRLSSVTDPLGHTTRFTYDPFGNRLSTTDPLGNTTTYSNDSEGRVVSVADAAGETTQLAYDGADLAQVVDSLGRTTTFSNGLFGSSGGVFVSSSDPLGHVTQNQYDALDQLTGFVDALGGTSSFAYDGDGSLQTVTDPNHHTTTYTYDSMDRPWTRTDPLGNSESYQHDGSGNLTQFTDRRGKITTYSYDSLDRKSFVGFGMQAGPTYESTVSYNYDSGDRLTQIVDSITGTITLGYDGLDRLTSETTPQGNVGYAYDIAGRRQTMTVAGQPTVNYTLDATDNLTQIVQGSSTIQFGSDAVGRRTTLALPNGIVTSYSYNNLSELTAITYSRGPVVFGNLSYGYDQNGQRAMVSGSFAPTAIPYPVATATYNANNQLTTWGATPFSYDGNGNLTNDGAHNYAWDARNHLNQIDSGATASFVYDPFGRRVSKNILGATSSFLYDGENPVQELSGTTATANVLAGSIDEYFSRTDASGTRYFVKDALGSTIALTDEIGALQTTYGYDPFGNTTVTGASTANSSAYTGRELDATGLYFYRARYYNPIVGRFLSEDPLGFRSGQNFYTYVANYPTGFADPLGLFATDDRIKLTRAIDIDYWCPRNNAGACTTSLKAKVECTCECGDEGWKAKATLAITGNMYVNSGLWPYKGRRPKYDKSVQDADSAIAHEYSVHINPAIGSVTPAIKRLEARTFKSEQECKDECKKTSDFVGRLFGAMLNSTQKADVPPEH